MVGRYFLDEIADSNLTSDKTKPELTMLFEWVFN